jgi:phosphate transport system protein
MGSDHLSSQFDSDLANLQSRVLQMGGIAEQQFRAASEAYVSGNRDAIERVLKQEPRVNELELAIDDDCSHIIARRQPTASDLRMVMGISKAVTDLERVGDEAAKIARIARDMHGRPRYSGFPLPDMRRAAEIAANMLRDALDAFARLDSRLAAQIVRTDVTIDVEFQGIVRQIITYVMEDSRSIGSALDSVLVAKAIERVGDHAKNIAEYVVYIDKGTDVRHTSIENIEREAKRDTASA